MNEKVVTCKEVMHYICESLGEDLNSEKCIAIKNHLDECSDCKNYYETVEITIDCYRKYSIKMPKNVHERLMKFLDLNDCD